MLPDLLDRRTLEILFPLISTPEGGGVVEGILGMVILILFSMPLLAVLAKPASWLFSLWSELHKEAAEYARYFLALEAVLLLVVMMSIGYKLNDLEAVIGLWGAILGVLFGRGAGAKEKPAKPAGTETAGAAGAGGAGG